MVAQDIRPAQPEFSLMPVLPAIGVTLQAADVAVQRIGLQDFPGFSNTVNKLHLLMVPALIYNIIYIHIYIHIYIYIYIHTYIKSLKSIQRKSPQGYRALQCLPILGSAKGSQSSKKNGNAK